MRVANAARVGAFTSPPPGDLSTVTFVQQVATDGTSGSSSAPVATLSSVTTTVGNMLILRWYADAAVSSIADSKGNTWVRDQTYSTATPYWGHAHCMVTTALTSADTITVTLASATSYHGFTVSEWSGLTAYGGNSVPVSNVTATTRTANTITVGNGDLVLTTWVIATATDSGFAVGSGWTAFPTAVYSHTYLIESMYQVASSAGNFTPSATGSSVGTYRGVAAYYY